MSAFRQRLLAHWPLLAAVVFSLYSWVLLGYLFKSQTQLKADAEHQQLQEGKARASAYALLFEDLRLRISAVSESAEVVNYLTNRDLGMSLRYGLNANIFDINARLKRLSKELAHHGRPVFERVLYLDESGQIVADTQLRGANPGLSLDEGLPDSGWQIDRAAQQVLTYGKVDHRGQNGGVVIGLSSLTALLGNMPGNGGSTRVIEFLLDASGRELWPAQRNFTLPPAAIAQILAKSAGTLAQLDLAEAGELDGQWLLDAHPLPESPLILARLLSTEAVYGHSISSALFLGAVVVPLLVIFYALMYQRMRNVDQALHYSRKRFETVFEHISDAIMVLPHSTFKVLEVNPRMLSMFGLTRADIPHLDIDDISAGGPEFCHAEWLRRQRQASAATIEPFPWHARDRNGRLFWVEVSLFEAPVDGERRMLVLMHDITRSKAQEQALRDMLAYQQQLNAKLEDAQVQLIQSEKMASIGQLAAGIAHEINNPIGFINANMGTLKSYMEDLFKLVATYEQAQVTTHPAVRAARSAIDYDLIREDFPVLIRETEDGISRVVKIVRDMREFSHIDDNAWQRVNLHVGLESTLNVVWNEIKYKAAVVREYGKLPEVECLPGQINQVVMNLLVNAAHAIEQRGRITLRTGADDRQAWFEIEDDGSGIAPEHLSRIFDPFFTTKPVGKGTGLGLSLVYGIVKKHDGNIDVESTLGVGTRIRVSLPLKRESRECTEDASPATLLEKG